jgi:hypothetical protein
MSSGLSWRASGARRLIADLPSHLAPRCTGSPSSSKDVKAIPVPRQEVFGNYPVLRDEGERDRWRTAPERRLAGCRCCGQRNDRAPGRRGHGPNVDHAENRRNRKRLALGTDRGHSGRQHCCATIARFGKPVPKGVRRVNGEPRKREAVARRPLSWTCAAIAAYGCAAVFSRRR